MMPPAHQFPFYSLLVGKFEKTRSNTSVSIEYLSTNTPCCRRFPEGASRECFATIWS